MADRIETTGELGKAVRAAALACEFGVRIEPRALRQAWNVVTAVTQKRLLHRDDASGSQPSPAFDAPARTPRFPARIVVLHPTAFLVEALDKAKAARRSTSCC